jgi:hypothetical protein
VTRGAFFRNSSAEATEEGGLSIVEAALAEIAKQ